MKKICLITIIASFILGCANDKEQNYIEKINKLEKNLVECQNEIKEINYRDSLINIKKEEEIAEEKKRKENAEANKKQRIAEEKKRKENAEANKKKETIQNDEWHTDLNKAINLSVQTGKPLFLFFTGSDWCGWCIRLQKEVFFLKEFKKWADDNVILVELDFPRRTPIADNLKKQNRELAQMFGVRGYPTVWFVIPEPAEGKVNFNKLGSQGYVAGGPKAWITGANKILKNR